MEELARKKTSTAAGLISFSQFGTELVLSFPFRLTDRRVSLPLSKMPLFQIVTGNGVVWTSPIPRDEANVLRDARPAQRSTAPCWAPKDSLGG